MAIQDVIKRLIYQFSSTGADQVAADLGKVNAEQEKLAVSSQDTTKASLDLEKSFDNLERRFDSTIRAQQDYAKVQERVNAAVAQHPELQDRANNVLEQAAAKFDKATSSADAFSKLLDKGRESLAGFAVEGGPVGGLLGSFGPWGVAAAAGIGLVSKALEYLKVNAEAMGNTAASMKNFADNTGLTITQIRGLNEAGAQVGMSADAVGSAMQKFTSNLEAAHQGSGALYDGLRRIDTGLADQIKNSRDDAQAFDILAKAINSTTDATTKAALAKAAFGKGGASMVGVAGITGDAGGMNAYADATVKASGVTSELIDRVGTLQTENKALEESNKLLAASIYAEPVLERTNAFLKMQEKILQQAPAILAAMTRQNVPMFGDPEAAGGAIPIRTPALNADTAATQANTAAKQDNAAATKAGTVATEASKGGLMDEVAAQYANTRAKIDNTNAAMAQASQSAANVAALGSAATATEIAQARIDALTASFDNGKISADIYARAVAAITNSLNQSAISATAAAAAQSTLGDLMRQNIGGAITLPDITKQTGVYARDLADNFKDIGVQGKVLYDNSTKTADAMSKTADATAKTSGNMQMTDDATIGGAKSAATLADGMNAAALASARMKQDIEDIDWEKALLGMSTMAAGMSNFLPMGLGGLTPDQANAPSNAPPNEFSGAKGTMANMSSSAMPTVATASGLQAWGSARDIAAASWDTGLGWTNLNHPASTSATAQAAITQAVSTGSIDSAIAALQGAQGDQFSSAVQQLYGLKISGAMDNAGKIAASQQEISYLQGQPPSLQNLTQITSLQQSIDQLKSSTDTLNSTNTTTNELLSPYYSQDPRTSHIGFRSQGMASGGYVDVPGGSSANDNMLLTMPVASGERVYVDPMTGTRGGGGTVVNLSISSPVIVQAGANTDAIGRTLYQSNQALAKQIRSAMPPS
jgi:hypothetical protein